MRAWIYVIVEAGLHLSNVRCLHEHALVFDDRKINTNVRNTRRMHQEIKIEFPRILYDEIK